MGKAVAALGKGQSALATTLTSLVTAIDDGNKAVRKAEDEKDEDKDKDKDDEVGKALRKARIAVRKAEDDDEDDDKDDKVEKARVALKAADASVSKAEDDADDDDKEKASEKARSELKTYRESLKGIVEKRAAAKATKDAAVAAGAPAAAPASTAAAAPTADVDAQVRKAMEPIAAALGRKVDDLMAAVQGASRSTSAPPEFAKAVAARLGAGLSLLSLCHDVHPSGNVAQPGTRGRPGLVEGDRAPYAQRLPYLPFRGGIGPLHHKGSRPGRGEPDGHAGALVVEDHAVLLPGL